MWEVETRTKEESKTEEPAEQGSLRVSNGRKSRRGRDVRELVREDMSTSEYWWEIILSKMV